MTREIKFRAFVNSKTIIYFSLKDLVCSNDHLSSNGFSMRLVKDWIKQGNQPDRCIHSQDDDVSCVLKSDIYTGDIVKSWLQGEEDKFEIDVIEDNYPTLFSGHAFDNSWLVFEAIGNIYENPELISG